MQLTVVCHTGCELGLSMIQTRINARLMGAASLGRSQLPMHATSWRLHPFYNLKFSFVRHRQTFTRLAAAPDMFILCRTRFVWASWESRPGLVARMCELA